MLHAPVHDGCEACADGRSQSPCVRTHGQNNITVHAPVHDGCGACADGLSQKLHVHT